MTISNNLYILLHTLDVNDEAVSCTYYSQNKFLICCTCFLYFTFYWLFINSLLLGWYLVSDRMNTFHLIVLTSRSAVC